MRRAALTADDKAVIGSLRAQGKTRQEIAAMLGCTYMTVWLHDPTRERSPSPSAPSSPPVPVTDDELLRAALTALDAARRLVAPIQNRNAIYWVAITVDILRELGEDVSSLDFLRFYRSHRYLYPSNGRIAATPPIESTQRMIDLVDRILRTLPKDKP